MRWEPPVPAPAIRDAIMPPKTTPTQETLEPLGAPRLAALLAEFAAADPAIKRRLRLELAGASSPTKLIAEITRRLATLARSRGFVEGPARRTLIQDLDTQRRAIVEQVAPRQPAEALDLMWRFAMLATPILERVDDSGGAIAPIFSLAVDDLAALATAARPDPRHLADQTFHALTLDGFGLLDGLVVALARVLGPAGLEHLKQRVLALSKQPVPRPPEKDRKVVGYASRGPVYEDEIKESGRVGTVRSALRAIADAQGDVDAYIAQFDAPARQVPRIAADIARRLVAANRAEEALQVLGASEPRGAWRDPAWDAARIEALEALGRAEEAQAARWATFERSLSPEPLRAYLKRLPDFEDFDAEQRALVHAEQFPSLAQAIHFLLGWPALDRAARAITSRAAELDGNLYELLTPAAAALGGKYPLAATLALRAMIDFTLKQARLSRYGHAARHLRDCAALAGAITDRGAFETHEAYVARLRQEHGRKSGFWSRVT